MDISNKVRYGAVLKEQLCKLEEMHDKFREQKEFCFTQMFKEFGLEVGFVMDVEIYTKLPSIYTNIKITTICWGADEYVHITAIDKSTEKEISIEPYYLDVYEDFEFIYSDVYDYLVKVEEEKRKPSDEFAMATYNYLTEECKFADKNHTDLNMFSSELRGHNLSLDEELFDVNIGAFCFTIRLSKGGNYFVCDNFEIWDKNGNVRTESIKSVNERLHNLTEI